MSQLPQRFRSGRHPEFQYTRAPVPLHFPEEALMPEGKTHLTLRTFLYQLLKFALGPAHSVGSEQFVYFNAANPRKCVAPDAFVKLNIPDTQFGTWKTWERGGPPDLAIEIVSPNENADEDWNEKFSKYFECGVSELVRFDPTAPGGARLRVWDRIDDDLVERVVVADRTPCVTLNLGWIVTPVAEEPVGLRLEHANGSLVESAYEAESRGRHAEAKAREAEAKAREAAEARVRELEEELRRLRGS
jgi:Uma2 family endonuclease